MSTPLPPSAPAVLKRGTERLLRADERPQFDRLLENQHHLANAHLAGQTLRYVAELDGQGVALLTFSAAAYHLKRRERWIRWTPRQCARRLRFVGNNSRFRVLPERARYPNLASRVLGLCLRRLGADWEAQWHHPVLGVASFVDESRYRGTGYRAWDFEAGGRTESFARASRDFYPEHGQAGAPTDETGCYCTSAVAAQANEADLLEAILGHWDASENGPHYRRDVTFGEDACGGSQRGAAQVLATLRNLALGRHELAPARGQIKVPSARSGCRQLTFTQALAWLKR